MKKITSLTLALLISLFSLAGELVFIPTGTLDKTKEAFSQQNLTIHFYNDLFAIGTADSPPAMAFDVLDKNAWGEEGTHYYILYFNPENPGNYISDIRNIARELYRGDDFLVVATDQAGAVQLYPAIRGGMVNISQARAGLPSDSFNYTRGTLSYRADIATMVAQVDVGNLQQMVQHMQNYGNRNAYTAQGILAQNWIYSKFDSLGLNVVLHDFYMPGGPASDNVIATLTGTKTPNEFVVLGAHYDTYTYSGAQPGADDNATGTAGILEIARILSQYEFDKSIIFATWGGEEYGLYGSAAWASQAAAFGTNILGYFNIDMAGYLQPGSYIHTDLIGPASAAPLKQFYTDVCSIYLPDFIIEPGMMTGGNSDHSSFNNNGYMGIFPFEDSQNYSPYIHTSNDIIGPSVNNFEQHELFVKAVLASVATMANLLPAPKNLTAIAEDEEVIMEWTGVDSVDYYNIYRDLDPVPYSTSTETSYIDQNVVNETSYTYFVTAVFLNSGEESGPSNTVTVVPMPPIVLPFYDDFETGAPYWTRESSWGLTNSSFHSADHSVSESPTGNYAPNMNASLTLRSINLAGATAAQISFWTNYRIEYNNDYMYLEVSADDTTWNTLSTFTGNQVTWTQKTYSLNAWLDEPNVTIRFRFYSDNSIQYDGMYIDDLEIMVSGVGMGELPSATSGSNILFHPNPARNKATIDIYLETEGRAKLQLLDPAGRLVKSISDTWFTAGNHQVDMDISDLPDGIYIGTLETSNRKIHRKFLIAR